MTPAASRRAATARPAAAGRASGALVVLAALAGFPLWVTNGLVTPIAVDTSRSGMRCSSAAGPMRSPSPRATGS